MRVSFFINSALFARQALGFPLQASQSPSLTHNLRRQDQPQPPPGDLPKDDIPDTLPVPGATNTFIKAEDIEVPKAETPDDNFQKVNSDNPPLAAEGSEAGKNMIAGGDKDHAERNTLDEGSAHPSLKKAELPPEIADITCTNSGITDANMFDQDRWEQISTDKVLSLVNAEWMTAKRRSKTRLGYSQFVSNYFNGPEGVICSEMSNKPCAEIIQCDNTNHPAGYFILNSMATMHGNMYAEMDVARSDLTSGMKSFLDVFAPEAPPDKKLEMFKSIADIALMIAGMGSAFSWNKLIETSSKFTSDSRGWAKDSFNTQVAFAFNMAKDNAKGPKNKAEQALDLEDFANQYYKIMMDMIIEFNKAMFDGSPDGVRLLTAAFRKGKFMPNNGVGIDTKAFKDEINGAVYGKLIMKAWLSNPEYPRHALILETDEPCDGKRTFTGKYFSDDTAKKTLGCVDGKAHYLLEPVGRKYCPAYYDDCSDDSDWFKPLPGGDNANLNSGKWGAINIDLIARSVRDGWRLNGEKNGWAPQVEPPTDGDLTAWFDQSRPGSPAYWSGIPFCSMKGFEQVLVDIISLSGDQGPFYPCR